MSSFANLFAKDDANIISQSLTTTIFKRFVVYIEDLRRGFATG